MNETHETNKDAAAERAVDDLMAIGKVWARYGLSAGKAALETSATTLQRTASFLGNLSKTIGAEPDEAKPKGEPEPAAPQADAS
jgi:hypothetical protein